MKESYEQEVPTIEDAKILLKEAEKLFPGQWVLHSIYAGEAAKLIAEKCNDLNADTAYVLGLLHDVGRRNGKSNGLTTIGHMIGGYKYCEELGYNLLAKICMTHSCPTNSINDIEEVTNKSCSDNEYKFAYDFFNKVQLNDYDKLIQLCDALALPSGFTLIEKRLVDVALRHGVNDYIIPKWKAFMDIKSYFEKKMGMSIYSVLSGVVENTFEL